MDHLIKTTVRRNNGELLDAVRLRRGMPFRMQDGRTGKVAFLSGGDVHVDLDGPNPHCTGIVVKRACVKIKDGVVVGALPAARVKPKVSIKNGVVIVDLPGVQLASKSNGEQRPAVVVDLDRARIEREWQSAAED